MAVAWSWWRTRRFPLRLVAVTAATLSAWMAFRVIYYADLFPVTFHLKDESMWDWGLTYLHDTLQPYHLYAVFGAAAGAALVLGIRRVPFGEYRNLHLV